VIRILRDFASFVQEFCSRKVTNYGPSFPYLSASAAGADRHLGNPAYAINDYGRASVLRKDKEEGRLWLD
jgi:hypothetical protein